MRDYSPGETRFFTQIGKLHLLTPEEEMRLGKLARRGDRVARNKLVEHNIRLAIKMAKPWRGRGLPFEDLIQEAIIGLHRAADKFEPERGYRFSTYATWWIRHFLQRAVTNAGSSIRVPGQVVALRAKLLRLLERNPDATDEEIIEALACSWEALEEARTAARIVASLDSVDHDSDGAQPHEIMADPHATQPEEVLLRDEPELHRALRQLDPQERQVLELRFGFEGNVQSFSEIAEALGTNNRVVGQIHARALNRLKVILGGEREPGQIRRWDEQSLLQSRGPHAGPVSCSRTEKDLAGHS